MIQLNREDRAIAVSLIHYKLARQPEVERGWGLNGRLLRQLLAQSPLHSLLYQLSRCYTQPIRQVLLALERYGEALVVAG
jgi:hypothetical protein